MIPLLTLIVGLLLGFYGSKLYERLDTVIKLLRQPKEPESGIVRPEASKNTRNQPIDLSRDTGPIMRPSPDQVIAANVREREKAVRNL